ncbi:YbfB/YjiJ family MFS transporter [Streptomyces oryzae]|uniref:YbfB/YjiJ family MFS transporter n=1 Tax=Streptomyces oryzae TaxID=1434886 RepID=A0ABS3XGB5_9ACTN|nr:YbfB/YjiJ family MFS transporter [Streptomyces oryzae]MBO8194404.1 YbfB/YjiJ family MFS transporter [Streptomyces oryzae]
MPAIRAASAAPRLPSPPSRTGLAPHWRLGLTGMAAIAVTFGFARYGYGLFLPEFRERFGLSVSLVGLIGSASYAGYLVALLLVGGLVARFGPRPLVVVGGGCATVGTALVALATGPGTLTVGLVLAGSSSGWAWAPYADAVDRVVPPALRERVTGMIATGTAFGVAVAGPLALAARGTGWRLVWLVFAALSLATTVANARVLPSGPHEPRAPHEPHEPRGLRRFARREAVPLFATALLYGCVGAVYWAFAVEAVASAAGADSWLSPLFWTVMGLAGTAGVLTGHAIVRHGLRRVQTGLFAGMSCAVALLGTAPGSLPAVLGSAVVYGPCFMAGSGLLAVWSHRVFAEQPSTGFSGTVFFLGLGTLVGPGAVGAVAGVWGLRTGLLLTAALGALALAARPAGQVSGRRACSGT